MKGIKNVLIYPNPKIPVNHADTQSVCDRFDKNGVSWEIFDDEFCSDRAAKFDAIVALGGDGTMLSASKLAWSFDLPLLGINLGTLGYMSSLEMSELELLEKLSGDYCLETRMLLDIRVLRDGREISRHTALNEAVVERSPGCGIVSLDLNCDEARVCSYRADGLIVATPTGSSAYALSAGGPIIDTKLDAFCAIAVCPHAMGTRPLIFSPNSKLCICNTTHREKSLLLTADGGVVEQLRQGDTVELARSGSCLKLIRVKKDAFYDVLNKKMS